MAKLPISELLLPWFCAAQAEPAAQRTWDVSDSLLAEALDELQRGGLAITPDLRAPFATILEQFASDRSVESYLGTPGREKQLLAEIVKGRDLGVVLNAMAPEYVIELSSYLHPCDAVWLDKPAEAPVEVLSKVRTAAAAFLIYYAPSAGPKTDLSLETAVRAFTALLEPLLGQHLKVAGNKNNAVGRPTPACAGTRAIEIALQGVDPNLYPSAVMNMITKVKQQLEPTEHPTLTLMQANPLNALMCTLRVTDEDIARFRDDPINSFA